MLGLYTAPVNPKSAAPARFPIAPHGRKRIKFNELVLLGIRIGTPSSFGLN
jgi:hypothetical protein